VFINPEGDHYRTRLTHTLEVSQIARTIGRALMLNEDLIEAIALAHDVGHPPFGHAGESALDEAVRAAGNEGFRHYEQSLRIVEVLEPLNLTAEVRSGIGGHSKGDRDLSAEDGEKVSTLEAAVVRVSDRVAYLNHDLDDALRSGMIENEPDWVCFLGDTPGHRVGNIVEDIVRASLDKPCVTMSPRLFRTLNDLKDWLFENVYLRYPVVYPDVSKAKSLLKELFAHYVGTGNLPEGFAGVQGATDYVAGMTDRFAISAYVRLRVPTWEPQDAGKPLSRG
jgi:dGTPase